MTSSSEPRWLHRYLTEYLTLDEVGELEGVTREGIRQRLARLGIKPRTANETRLLRERELIDRHAEAIGRLFLASRDVADVAGDLRLPHPLVERAVEELVPDYRVLSRAPRRADKRYSTHELAASLVEAAKSAPGNLTTNRYDEFVTERPTLADGRRRPGKQGIMLRFGSWRNALAFAGLPANPHGGPDKSFDEADSIAAVTECWRQTGQPPTAAAYDVWQRDHSGRPSMATVRNRTGSWNVLLIRAWQLVHGIKLDQEDEDAVVPPALLTAADEISQGQHFVPYLVADEGVEISLGAEHVAAEYNSLERAVRSHAVIQNAIAALAQSAGLLVWSPGTRGPAFDIAFSVDADHILLVEVKSATSENLELQLRIGLGQILRYAHQLRCAGYRVTPMIAIERRPEPEWAALLHDLNVELVAHESIGHDLDDVLSRLPAAAVRREVASGRNTAPGETRPT